MIGHIGSAVFFARRGFGRRLLGGVGAVLLGAAGLAVVAPGVAGAGPLVVATVAVGTNPVGVSSDGTHVWVANYGANTVSEINAATGAVVATKAVGSFPYGVSSDGTHVWVANLGANTVSEINAATGAVVATIAVGTNPAVSPLTAPTCGWRTTGPTRSARSTPPPAPWSPPSR